MKQEIDSAKDGHRGDITRSNYNFAYLREQNFGAVPEYVIDHLAWLAQIHEPALICHDVCIEPSQNEGGGIPLVVDLPVHPPVLPMLAKRMSELPADGDWIFEPKWDGFRALVFRDGDEILIQSRDEKPLNRYFPELLGPLRSVLPRRCVLD